MADYSDIEGQKIMANFLKEAYCVKSALHVLDMLTPSKRSSKRYRFVCRVITRLERLVIKGAKEKVA